MDFRTRLRATWSLLAGATLALAAVPFTLPPPIPWFVLVPAVFLTGTVVWWAMASDEPVSLRRGVIAGAVTGILSHVTFWAAVVVTTAIQGRPFFGPLENVAAVGVFSLVGILVAGVITAPIGAVAGALVALLQSRLGSTEGDSPETATAGR